MFLKLFNSNSNFSLAVFILSVIVLWAKAFTNDLPMPEPVPVSPLYHIAFNYLNNFTIICGFISVALVILEALLINYVLSENDLIPRNSYLSAFIFVIVSSFFNDFIFLNPVLLANLFIIASIWLFFKLYEEQEAYATVFNIGSLISIASMFYFPAAVFILLIWIGFVIYRLFFWRVWVISILGFSLPYLFLGAFYFWFGSLSIKITAYRYAFSFINFHDFSPTSYAYIVLIVLSLFLLITTFKLLAIINEKAIRIRKFLSFMIWFMIVSLISLNVSTFYGVLGFVMMLTSVSVIFTLYVNFTKRTLWAETMMIILVLLLFSGRLGLWNLI